MIRHDELLEEISDYNSRNTQIMSEYHESGIYSLKVNGIIIKITNLRDAVSCVRFLNNYLDYFKEATK